MSLPTSDENLTPQVLASQITSEIELQNTAQDASKDNTSAAANPAPTGANLSALALPAQNAPQVLAPDTHRENDDEREPTPAEYAQWEAMWGEGENTVTRVGRAAFALLAGGFLVWMQQRTPVYSSIDPTQHWNAWIQLSILSNFLIPALIVWLFFAQGLRPLHWLSDQRLNAWNYGCHWQFARHAKLALLALAVMALPMWFVSRDPNVQYFYRNAYFPPLTDTRSLLWLLGTIVVYMACWEWFFRGFLLFGMAQGFGPSAAIGLQAIVFGLAHGGKPPLEMWSSFGGGLILGILCWREKSFVPAFFIHGLIHVVWAVMVLN